MKWCWLLWLVVFVFGCKPAQNEPGRRSSYLPSTANPQLPLDDEAGRIAAVNASTPDGQALLATQLIIVYDQAPDRFNAGFRDKPAWVEGVVTNSEPSAAVENEWVVRLNEDYWCFFVKPYPAALSEIGNGDLVRVHGTLGGGPGSFECNQLVIRP